MLCFAYLWGNSVFVSGDGTAHVKWLWPREPEVWGVDESDLWLVHPARSPHTRQQIWDPREHVPAKLFLRILHFDTRDHVKTVGGENRKKYVLYHFSSWSNFVLWGIFSGKKHQKNLKRFNSSSDSKSDVDFKNCLGFNRKILSQKTLKYRFNYFEKVKDQSMYGAFLAKNVTCWADRFAANLYRV